MHETEVRERIDRRGWGPFFNRLWVGGGMGWMADAMSISALGLVLPLIIGELGITRGEGGFIVSMTFVGFMVGALVTGKLADHFGRRTLLIFNILLFSVASLAIGFSQDFWSLLILRFVQGVGLGGEFPIISTFINEMSPKRFRDRITGLTTAFFAYAFALTPLIGLFLIPHLGWRGLFWALVVPVLVAIWIRRALPESPVYLARKGRHAEAEAALRVIEQGTADHPAESRRAVAESNQRTNTDAPVKTLWSWRMGLIVVFWFLTFLCQYGFASWVPTAMAEVSGDGSSEYVLTAILFSGMIFGYLSAAWGAGKLNTGNFLKFAYAEYGIALVLFGVFDNVVLMMVFGWLAAAGYGFTTISAYSYIPSQFDTAIRGTGMGVATGLGRIGAIIGPLVVGVLSPTGSLGMSFIAFGVAALAAVALVPLLTRRTEDAVAPSLQEGRR